MDKLAKINIFKISTFSNKMIFFNKGNILGLNINRNLLLIDYSDLSNPDLLFKLQSDDGYKFIFYD